MTESSDTAATLTDATTGTGSTTSSSILHHEEDEVAALPTMPIQPRDGVINNDTHHEDNIDDTNNNIDNIQYAFDLTVKYMRNNTEIGLFLQKYLSTEQQLTLYGLYKQSTIISTEKNDTTTISSSSSSSSSWWKFSSLRDQTKRRAWEAYQHLHKSQAMLLYLQTLMEYSQSYHHQHQEFQSLCDVISQAISIKNRYHGNDDQNYMSSTNHSNTKTETGTTVIKNAGPTTVPKASWNDKQYSTPLLLKNTNTRPLTNKNSDESLTTFLLGDLLGISPLQARGTLDISNTDLYFAVRQCVHYATSNTIFRTISKQNHCSLYRTYENDIRQRWIQAWHDRQPTSSIQPSVNNHIVSDHSLDVMVGLSVRSLLDMYIQVQQYPPNSEIIISPPITVPGMMAVLEHHQIQCVGVDLPSQSMCTSSSSSIDDTSENDIVVSINLDGIQKAMTSKTVAVMIVHVFGMIVASDDEMQQLRSMIDNHNQSNPYIDIVEDCAECFTGLHSNVGTTIPSPYMGSPYADASFFSFGMIKNMTAIHGGIAVTWNPANRITNHNKTITSRRRHTQLIESMTRIQHSYCNDQSNMIYFKQVCKSFILKSIAQSPLWYGLIYSIVSGLGWNFDSFVTTFLRGFPMDRKQMMHRIRHRPSLAMLALLRRRLHQPPSSTIMQRMKFCTNLTGHIRNERRRGMDRIRTVATNSDCENYFWLYPIMVKDRAAILKQLRQCGFDATSGTSQLCCVSSSRTCPVANEMMDSILYLPTPSRSNTEYEVDLLLPSLKSAMQGGSNSVTSDSPIDRIRKRKITLTIFTCIMVIFFWTFFITVTISLLQIITILTTIYATFLWLLRIQMGKFYVESSKAFAKYSYLIYESNQKSSHCSKPDGLLSHMESIQLPINSFASETTKRSVLLTGATGFVGSMLLRDLLYHRKALHLESVIVLCRAKKGKKATERVQSLLEDAMFSFLSDVDKQTFIKVIEGDIILPQAGLSDETITYLFQQTCVTHIFNCAASVSFTQSLPEAAMANILSPLNLQSLGASICKERVQFVHVSTAFVHGGCFGSNGEPLLEELFSLGQFDPIKIYRSMTGTQFYASKAMSELSFPNTYTFSKCIAEHLLLSNDPSSIIIRPSIVGPAVEFPYEGWAGRTPSTIVAAACLYLSYQWNIWSFGRHLVPIVPIDVVSRFVINKAFYSNRSEINDTCLVDESSSDESYEKVSQCTSTTSSLDKERKYQIFHATWDVRSPRSAGFTWFEYAGAVTQVGCVTGCFSRSTAYLGLLFATRLIPRMKLTTHRFATIHDWCVKHPFDWMTQIRKKLGFSTSQFKLLRAYLNLPLLFYPFMNNSYNFHSELIAPLELSGEHYLMMCVSAAHDVVKKSRPNHNQGLQRNKRSTPEEHFTHMSLLANIGLNNSVSGPSLIWAISQPHGNFLVRVSAWLLVHILKRCYSEISVDIQSFASAILALKESGVCCTILAPTHRSIFDCLILTLICFAVPELQIGMPSIAAADLFERLPLFGWLLHFLGAFFVRRGRMSIDPNLMNNVSTVKAKSFHTVIELFIEGTRSRDRRFVQPRTGVLRCLYDPCCQQTIVPIVINYECVAEQESLVAEASGGGPSELHISGMILWLSKLLRGQVKLGRVHVVACEPISFYDPIGPEINDVVLEIQRRQAKNIFVSEYHVLASSQVLGVELDVVNRAFKALGAKTFPSTVDALNLPSNTSGNLSILFQISPLLAPLFASVRPAWSNWLCANHGDGTAARELEILTNPDAKRLMTALLSMFDEADRRIDAAVKTLRAIGFIQPQPRHILQTATRDFDNVPTLLLQAAIEIRFRDNHTTSKIENTGPVTSLVRRSKVGADEALGYWGFYESQFVLQMGVNGGSFVRMEGNKYSIRGKKISGLLTFMEGETAIIVDPFNEAFTEISDNIKVIPSKICDTSLELLKQAVPNISQTTEDRIRHGTGHSQEDIYLIRSKEIFRVPDVVVRPASVSEVASMIKLAKLNDWCVIPFGGGTNVSNALRCPPYDLEPRPIVSLDMRDLCQILWIDEENGIAHVEAGITGRQLEQALAIRGYTMGHEPDSIEFSTLGGWIATKASGMKRNKYGNIEDIVKEVCVMGPDGVMKHGSDSKQHVWGRESCGIDLRNLMLGSEGCLGVITSASIRICRTAETKDYDSILFHDFHTGLRFVRDVARLGSDCPASVRLLDNEHFRLGHALRPDDNSVMASFTNYCFGAFVKWKGNFDSKTMVCVTLMYESNTAEVKRQKRAVHRVSERYGGVRLGSAAGRASYELTFMIAYIRDFALSYYFLGESFETFAPWSQIATIITETKSTIRCEHEKRCLPGKPFIGCRVTQLYHEGACLYFYFCMNFAGVPNASSVYSEIERAARAVILANGGSLSHHHGIGKLRSSFLPTIDSEPFRGVVHKLKHAIDPDNIFGARNGGFSNLERA